MNDHLQVVKLVLELDDVDSNSKDGMSRTPLSWAAARGQEKIVKLLLAKDTVDHNSQDMYGQIPLLLAAGNGHEAVVKLLLANSATLSDSKDKFGRTPLSWAASRGNINAVKLILKNYERHGIVVREKDVDIGRPPAADQESRIYCGICLWWIPNINSYHHCEICVNGDFDICEDCKRSSLFGWFSHVGKTND
ncbi:hypothetical protein LTR43_011895 [Exophiala xenobiotica]